MSQPNNAEPRPAATVLLMRERAGGELELFLVRRHRNAGFMASAYVFPGGVTDAADAGDARVTAIRELFEEAGVLLADDAPTGDELARWRRKLDAGETSLESFCRATSTTLRPDTLHYFAHWITPSAEGRRYSATFFIARLPDGQIPSFDNRETVDELWATPTEALARAAELKLPPPQIRTLAELVDASRDGWRRVVELCEQRQQSAHPILPRLAPMASGFALLLPWDPDYQRTGTGDALPMPRNHPLAVGPSRFVLGANGWQNVEPE